VLVAQKIDVSGFAVRGRVHADLHLCGLDQQQVSKL
jgi:hypothetical protein